METKFIACALLSLLFLSCSNSESNNENTIPSNTKRTIIFGDSTSTIIVEPKAETSHEFGLQKDSVRN